jgi:hypothetical protein
LVGSVDGNAGAVGVNGVGGAVLVALGILRRRFVTTFAFTFTFTAFFCTGFAGGAGGKARGVAFFVRGLRDSRFRFTFADAGRDVVLEPALARTFSVDVEATR